MKKTRIKKYGATYARRPSSLSVRPCTTRTPSNCFASVSVEMNVLRSSSV